MVCEKCGEEIPTIEKTDREGRVIYICMDCLSKEILHEEGRVMPRG